MSGFQQDAIDLASKVAELVLRARQLDAAGGGAAFTEASVKLEAVRRALMARGGDDTKIDALETSGEHLNLSAAEAMRASVKLTNGILGVMDLLQGRGALKMRLSDINRTATIKAMRRDAETVMRFVNALENS